MPAIKKPAKTDRPVLYRKVEIVRKEGKDALTADLAKELLGWEEVIVMDDSCCQELLTLTGRKVRLKNYRNRPIYTSQLQVLKQKILNRRFRLNWVTVVIGKTGLVVEGNHRLLALILAHQDWLEGDDKEHWQELWEGKEPVLETLLVYGGEEDDDTFATYNSGRPSTLADVVYRTDAFAKLKQGDKRACSRMLDFAVRLLWERTGEKEDPFAPRQTHEEAMDFVSRHPRLLRCVKHVFEESRPKKDANGELRTSLSNLVGPGNAAGLMYLMAVSASKGRVYLDARPRLEKYLDWSNWDRAAEFWTLLCGGKLPQVAEAVARAVDEGGGSKQERLAVICKAWDEYLIGNTIEVDKIALDNDDVVAKDDRRMLRKVTVGGIDIVDAYEQVNGHAVEEEKAKIKNMKEKKEQEEAKDPERSLADLLADLRREHPDKILLFKTKTGGYAAWDEDARLLAKLAGKTAHEQVDGIDRFSMDVKLANELTMRLLKAKKKVAIATMDKRGGTLVVENTGK